MDVEFGEWLPDQPERNNPGATLAKNVIAQAGGYSSLNSLVSFSDALGAACLGSFWMKSDGEVVNNFAGDAGNLYRLTGGTTWTEVSKVTDGYNATDQWEFTKFGGRCLATNQFDPLQYFDTASPTTFDDVAGSPPQASRIAVVRDFVVLGDLSSGPNRIHWSGFNNSELWTPSRATQCDFQDLFGNSGRVQKIVPGEYGVIFQEHSIRRMDYVGPPVIFQLDEVERHRGTPAPNSVVWTGGVVFYYGHDGFYMFDGVRSTPIGTNRVNKWFASQADITALQSMRGVIDRRNRLVMWSFSTAGLALNSRVIIYNWGVDRWSYAEIDAEMIAEYVSPGYTLDELDAIIGSDIDTNSISVDSDAYKGGSLNVQVFGVDHKSATFDGTPLVASITTKELGAGHKVVDTTAVRPVVEGSQATSTVQIGYRNQSNENVSYTAARATNDIGEANIRKNSRYQRYQVNISGGFDQATGVDVRSRVAGVR